MACLTSIRHITLVAGGDLEVVGFESFLLHILVTNLLDITRANNVIIYVWIKLSPRHLARFTSIPSFSIISIVSLLVFVLLSISLSFLFGSCGLTTISLSIFSIVVILIIIHIASCSNLFLLILRFIMPLSF